MEWILVGVGVLLVGFLLLGLRRKQIEDPGGLEEETGGSWAVTRRLL